MPASTKLGRNESFGSQSLVHRVDHTEPEALLKLTFVTNFFSIYIALHIIIVMILARQQRVSRPITRLSTSGGSLAAVRTATASATVIIQNDS